MLLLLRTPLCGNEIFPRLEGAKNFIFLVGPLVARMTKRVAEDTLIPVGVGEASSEPPLKRETCAVVPAALVNVLFDPHQVCVTIGACQLLDLHDLWNLYQCCGSVWRALYNHPDIVVYREARQHPNIELDDALCRVFIERRDCRLLRSLRAHVAQTLDRTRRANNRANPHHGFQLACGLSIQYVRYLRDEFFDPLHVRPESTSAKIMGYACMLGTPEYMRLLSMELNASWPPDTEQIANCRYLAAEQGNVALLGEFARLYDEREAAVKAEDERTGVQRLYPETSWKVFQTALLSENAKSVEFALTMRQRFVEYMGDNPIMHCWERLPKKLETLRLMASERQRQGLSIDWEELYVRYMQHVVNVDHRILEWMAPLAINQFRARLSRDRHAKPLFMQTHERQSFRRACLQEWGLAEREVDTDWNVYPDCSDTRHYLFDHYQHARIPVWGHQTFAVVASARGGGNHT